MGKGFNNFMSKKAFHPGSYANQKRIHEAEERAAAKRKHDEDTLAQYQKEQELFNQKSLVSKQSKEKLSLNFMYDAPPGVEKPDDKKSDKVEWKGSSGKVHAHSTSFTLSSSSSTDGPNICLDWKRDRPAKRVAEGTRQEAARDGKEAKEIKGRPIIKEEKGVNIDIKPDLRKDVALAGLKREVKRESELRGDQTLDLKCKQEACKLRYLDEVRKRIKKDQ